MKWETENTTYGDPEFLNKDQEVKQVKTVEFLMNDGYITGVLIEQKDGTLIAVQNKETDCDGCRRELCVSVCQPNEEK